MYTIEDAITNCAFWNNGHPDRSLMICRDCPFYRKVKCEEMEADLSDNNPLGFQYI